VILASLGVLWIEALAGRAAWGFGGRAWS
jgi:hypothetical protein